MSVNNNLQIATLAYQQALKVELSQAEQEVNNAWESLKSARTHTAACKRKFEVLTEAVVNILNTGLKCNDSTWQSLLMRFALLSEARSTALAVEKNESQIEGFYKTAQEKHILIQRLLTTSSASLHISSSSNNMGPLVFVPVRLPDNFFENSNNNTASSNNQNANVSTSAISLPNPVVESNTILLNPNLGAVSAFRRVNTNQNSSSNNNNSVSLNNTNVREIEEHPQQKKQKTKKQS